MKNNIVLNIHIELAAFTGYQHLNCKLAFIII